MRISHWTSRHARSVLFLLTALIAGGVLGTLALPVSLFPHVDFPRIRVNLEAGDRPAEQMELQVTRPIELALRGIPGARGVESTTSRGSAEVSVSFEAGQDMAAAYLHAQAEVNRVMQALPSETSFSIRRMDPTVFPVIAYSLTSPTRPLTELHDLAQRQLAPVLSEVRGVGRVSVDGGDVAEIHVIVDPATLASHGLSVGDVSSLIASTNSLAAVGRMEDHGKHYLVVADAKLSLKELENLPVRSTGGLLRLSDIADIQRAAVPNYTHSVADGHDAVLVNVFQQPGGNTVNIAAGIRDALAAEAKRLPPDVAIACWYDQSDLITASATGVRDVVFVGVALAALVLLLFLRDWRMTLIATLSVPVVLAITAGVLYVLGQSFNIMTLGGMAAAVGLIIDDAIVMSEHIVRRLAGPRPSGVGPAVTTLVNDAADEFSRPLIGSSLSTIVIHIPPAFLVGVFGAFFAALSLSMAASLVISFAVAWIVVPVLAARVLRGAKPRGPGRIARTIAGAYEQLMSRVLRWPTLVLLAAAPLLLLGYLSFEKMESGLMPQIDEGGFVIDYIGPPGASIAEMDRLLGHVERALQETPEVRHWSRRTGFSLGGDISETNTGDFFVRLGPLPRRPISVVMDEVRERVEKEVPGLEIEPLLLMEDLLGDLSGQPQPVVVNLFADDERRLAALAPKVAAALEHVPGLSSIENGVIPAGDALTFHVDRDKAALEGLDPQAVTTQISELLEGAVATRIEEGQRSIGVRVWTPLAIRRQSQQLRKLQVRAPDGHWLPLGRIATFDTLPGQPEITRQDLQRVVRVTARSSRDLGSTIADVKRTLSEPGVIPPGVRFTLGGQYEQQRQAFGGTIAVVAAAVALVFMLLLLLYKSFRVAIAILITTGLAIASVFIGLTLTGTQLNISSMMGMVMIVGNVTEVAIFYYSELTDFHGSAEGRDRRVVAGVNRLRAITMTTLAAILALLPLALDWGHQAGMLKPLAIAIIAGLAVQLPLVLIVMPALLAILGVGRNANPALLTSVPATV